MSDVKSEMVSKVNEDIWARSLINGGCNLSLNQNKKQKI